MTVININLIAFNSSKSIGTLIYIKRLLEQISDINPRDKFFYIYIQKQFDVSSLVLPANSKIIYVPNFSSSLFRIAFEQLFFYFYLKKSDYFFTPCLSMPLFVRSIKVLTIHDMVPFIIKNKYGFFRKHFVPFMTKLSAKCADIIVTVSTNSKNDIIRILGIHADKIEIIYNFIPAHDKVINTHYYLTKLIDYDLTRPYFLNVSTLQPGKNVEGLIQAFGLFIEKEPNYQLCIVGNKGWGYESIFTLVKELGLERDVIFTGYLDDYQLSFLYNNCIGTVYVSFYEGFGIPPLEGFYHNKASISSNNSSLPEVVGKAGLFVDPYSINSIANGFESFIDHRIALEKYTTERTTYFSPQKITNSFLSIFK